MNRNMTDIGSARFTANRQREVAHRYILGLYKILENITYKISLMYYLKVVQVEGEDLTLECYIICRKLGLVIIQML